MVTLGEEIGKFECKVVDGGTTMFVKDDGSYNYVLVKKHGDRYKVQWGSDEFEDMIYILPGDEVVAEEKIIHKENPKEIVTETDREVTYDSEEAATEAAVQFMESFYFKRE